MKMAGSVLHAKATITYRGVVRRSAPPALPTIIEAPSVASNTRAF